MDEKKIKASFEVIKTLITFHFLISLRHFYIYTLTE